MRIRIRSRLVYQGHDHPRVWRWVVTLVDSYAEEDDDHTIHVGEASEWTEALRQGYVAWRFANMRWRAVPGAGEPIEIVR